MSTYTVFVNFLEDVNRYKVEIFSVYLTFNRLSNNISFVYVAQNFVIYTCLRMSTFWVFVNFLEDGNRYKAKIFRVYSTFNKVSNGISHFVVAQNFVIYTCLRMSTECLYFSEIVFSFSKYFSEIVFS